MLMRIYLLLAVLLLVSGCTSKEELLAQAMEQQVAQTSKDLAGLKQAIDKNEIRNLGVLVTYAGLLKNQRPELAELADNLAKDATLSGPLYSNLNKRFEEAKTTAKTTAAITAQMDELQSISEAASITLFNDALSDSINVIADLSNGALARVNAISRESEIAAQQDAGQPGSQLVGNPNYGQWQTNSSGMSFWQWAGMYALISNISGYNRPRYDSWSSRRPYSYYHDYGRSRFSSPKQRLANDQVLQRTQKTFASQGKSVTSPYAKKRVGASSLSRASHTPSKQSSFSRSTGSKSSYSKGTTNSGNVRSSSSRTSRGSSGSGGK